MFKIFFQRALAFVSLTLLAFSNNVSASGSSCSSVMSTYQSCVNVGSCSPYSSPEQIVAAHPHCFPGGASTSQAEVSSSSFVQVGANTSAVQSRLLGDSGQMMVTSAPVQGMAAGGKNAWNFWASVTGNDTRQAFIVGPNSIRHEFDVTNAVVGADYAIAQGMVLGVSGAFDHGSGSTQPTAGAAWEASTTKGLSIAPYFGYQISKELALDVSVGLGSGKSTGSGGLNAEADRQFYAANLGYSRWLKDLQFTGKLGYLHGEEKFGMSTLNGVTQNNTASKNTLDRVQLGAQVAYWAGDGTQPYAGLNYLSDRRASSSGGTDSVGKGAWQWGFGVNFFSLSKGVTGGLAFTQEEGRSNQRNRGLSANFGIRY